jgi:hypothetical protein
MATEHAAHQTLPAIRAGAAVRFRTPLLTRMQVSAIRGRRRVEAVELRHLDTGEAREMECDLVVFTADWIPDHELAVLAGIELDPQTRGPAVDPGLRTSRPGVFAVGNLLHGAETADIAALDGRHVAAAVVRHLGDEAWPASRVAIECKPPLGWIAPNAVSVPGEAGAAPPRGRFLLRSEESLRWPRVELVQGGRQLWSGRPRRLGPGRSARLPAEWAARVDPRNGPVTARLTKRA